MDSLLLQYTGGWYLLVYLAILLGMFIEGDGVLFAVAFLAHQGHLDPAAMFVTVFAATILADISWYHIGAYVQTKNNWFARAAKHITNPLAAHLVDRPRHSIILAKFLYGINHAIWAKAGALGLPFGKLFREDLLATAIWIGIIGGLGVASSAGLVAAKPYIHYAEAGLLVGLVFIITASKIFAHVFRKKL